MAPSPDLIPSDDAVREMLVLLTPSQRSEFDDGLSKVIFHFEVDRSPETADALLGYVRSWVVSIHLQHDQEWQSQMATTAERLAAGDMGEPVDAERLKEMLGL